MLAGLFFGLLTMKPQLGLLIPVALVLRAEWRCIASAAVTAAALFDVSSAVFGISAWSDYIHRVADAGAGPGERQRVDADDDADDLLNARIVGLPANVAFLAQALFTTLGAIAALVWTFSVARDVLLSRAPCWSPRFVATPYVFDYDMVVFGWVIWKPAIVCGRSGTNASRSRCGRFRC